MSDLCLVLGGDGTILQALRTYADTECRCSAINFGTVGFLAAAERDELESGSRARLRRGLRGDGASRARGRDRDGDADCAQRRLVHPQAARPGGGALVPPRRARRSGMSAATAWWPPPRPGSTGYNLANQGPILAWGVEGYVVSFIAPHTLTARALVVAPDDVLHVANAAGRDPVDVVLDGEPVGELGAARSWRSASARTSAVWRSCPARTSTGGSGRSSAASPTESRVGQHPTPSCYGRRSRSMARSRVLTRYGSGTSATRRIWMERKWWTLLAVCVATFMLLLDITIVNVALPAIQSDLNASLSSLQWVVDAYALTLASFLLVVGSLGDRSGAGGSSRSASASSPLASLLCGLSRDPPSSTSSGPSRASVGPAMFATSLALIAQEFEGSERANAIGVWGATVGGAVAVGPLVGGAITERVRLGVDLLRQRADRRRGDPAHRDQARERWRTGPAADRLAGPADLLPRPVRLIFGLIRGNPEGWASAQILASLIGARPAHGAFVVIETAARERDARPRRCSGSRPSPASRSSPWRSRPACSRCSSTSRSTFRTSSAIRRSRRACASCR